MALRHRKPTSPGRRFQTVSDFADVTKDTPEKSLLAPKPKTGGRNNYGRKTSRHRGGGHKQQYRIIDFKRNKDSVPAKVASIEYDPNRTCRIALLHYVDGEKRYILAPNGLKVGDVVESGPKADIRNGNALPMRFIPTGSTVHNVELRPGGGGKMARSAGMGVQLVAKDGGYATLRLPSTRCAACPSTVARRSASWATPSTSSSRSARPDAAAGRASAQTRGVAMNPVDHPLGGGEGRPPVDVTRSRRGSAGRSYASAKAVDALIIRRRRGRGARR